MTIKITTPLTRDAIRKLKTGDEILLSGVIFAARDAAHKKIIDLVKRGKRVPLNLKDAVIYYAAPAPAPEPRPIGSCGPTTSSRMDPFTPDMIRLGIGGMIGKGDRSGEVKKAIKKYECVYFLATGGIGALLSLCVKSARPILFRELGPEAVYKLEIKDFPLTVGIDSKGRDLYDKTRWKRQARIKKDKGS